MLRNFCGSGADFRNYSSRAAKLLFLSAVLGRLVAAVPRQSGVLFFGMVFTQAG
ncbi:hypothetical protein [Succinimonas amylolytica]|uniref:hypothetical protein n=1 Tax=Succinimonas amylolytica TaxID=83769 RepID=UPI0003649057|nr:hypothetical protein [Succinimonas amylolytica]